MQNMKTKTYEDESSINSFTLFLMDLLLYCIQINLTDKHNYKNRGSTNCNNMIETLIKLNKCPMRNSM